jgi:hypothetical protein
VKAGTGERRDGGSTVLYLEGECVNVVIDLDNVGDTAEHSAWGRGGRRRSGTVRDAEAWQVEGNVDGHRRERG